eukprot:scaffold6397_cov175-Ochromonas_danica.AAC.27
MDTILLWHSHNMLLDFQHADFQQLDFKVSKVEIWADHPSYVPSYDGQEVGEWERGGWCCATFPHSLV